MQPAAAFTSLARRPTPHKVCPPSAVHDRWLQRSTYSLQLLLCAGAVARCSDSADCIHRESVYTFSTVPRLGLHTWRACACNPLGPTVPCAWQKAWRVWVPSVRAACTATYTMSPCVRALCVSTLWACSLLALQKASPLHQDVRPVLAASPTLVVAVTTSSNC